MTGSSHGLVSNHTMDMFPSNVLGDVYPSIQQKIGRESQIESHNRSEANRSEAKRIEAKRIEASIGEYPDGEVPF